MTDPLLTIDEATRAFRTSPKTIRRRLAAGEIAGAYKRPGGRGPEWVMPEGSLRAAGFVPRAGADVARVPDDPEDRASYWERRAVDAEAAMRASAAPPARRRPATAIALAVLVGLAVVAVAFAAGRATGAGGGGAAPPLETGADLVRTMLTARTQPGEVVGVLGTVPADIVPTGRSLQVLDGGGVGADGPPRYIVVAADGREAAVFESVESSAELVLAVPTATTPSLWVYDGGREAVGRPGGRDRASTRPSVSDVEAPQASDDVDDVAASGPGEPAEAVGGGESVASAPASQQTVTVGPGDSFWSLAVDLVDGVDRSDAVVAQYWEALIDANADRLVEPGNPDLLHVGQDLVLPPAS